MMPSTLVRIARPAVVAGLLLFALSLQASVLKVSEDADSVALEWQEGYVVESVKRSSSDVISVRLLTDDQAAYQYVEYRSPVADTAVATAVFEAAAKSAEVTIVFREPWQGSIDDIRIGATGLRLPRANVAPGKSAQRSGHISKKPALVTHTPAPAVRTQTASTAASAQSISQVSLTSAVAEQPGPSPAADDSAALAPAEAAFREKNFAVAARLYEQQQNQAGLSDATRRLALERGAIARELNGQLAHAVAGYRRYLDQYPDTPGAERVSQRLNALVVDARPQSSSPSRREVRDKPLRTDVHIGQFYRRQELEVAGERSVPLDALFTDLDGRVAWQGSPIEGSLRVSATHVLDFSDRASERSEESRLRLGRVYLDLDHEGWGTSLRLGRQSNYDAGASGRFDGLVLEQSLSASSSVGLAAGYLVDSSFDGIDDTRPFVSLFLQHSFFDGRLDLSPYLVTQDFDGVKDREAVGLRGRWLGEQLRLHSAIDYDIYHAILNNAQLNGTWAFSRATNVSWNLARRRTPFLTTRNALIGQGDVELSELERDLVGLSLEDLALDRTSVNDVLGLTFSHRFNQRWRVTTDATMSRLSGTDDSQGVLGLPSRRDVYVSARVLADKLFGEGTSTSMWLRHSVSDVSQTTAMFWDSRFNLSQKLWLFPRLRYDYRTFDGSDRKETRMVPSLRLIWRAQRNVRFELESGYDITSRDMETIDVDSSGLFFRLGYRASF